MEPDDEPAERSTALARRRVKPKGSIRKVETWNGRTRTVTYDDTRLAHSVERYLAESPPRIVGAVLDSPPGDYVVASKTTEPGAFWYIRLDTRTGSHVGRHSCPYRAENPHENYPCIHIAAAWWQWNIERENQDPFLRRLNMANEPGTALQVTHAPGTALFHVPTRDQIIQTLTLAKALQVTQGSAIPKALDTPAKLMAVIMTGQELNFPPMVAVRRFFIVDGQVAPDGQCIAAMMERAGCDLIFHEQSDEAADIELVRPGRTPLRIRYTMEQAVKSGSPFRDEWVNRQRTGRKVMKPAWENHPADMLVWKAIARLGRRGAPDILNGIEAGLVRLNDVYDQVPEEDRQPFAGMELAAEDDDVIDSTPQLAYDPNDESFVEAADDQESAPSTEIPAEPTASAAIGSDATTSAPSPSAAVAEAGRTSPGPGPVASQDVPATPTATPPLTGTESHPERHLNFKEAHTDRHANFRILSAFQKAISGLGTLPADHEAMTLDEIVIAMGGNWPSDRS